MALLDWAGSILAMADNGFCGVRMAVSEMALYQLSQWRCEFVLGLHCVSAMYVWTVLLCGLYRALSDHSLSELCGRVGLTVVYDAG